MIYMRNYLINEIKKKNIEIECVTVLILGHQDDKNVGKIKTFKWNQLLLTSPSTES